MSQGAGWTRRAPRTLRAHLAPCSRVEKKEKEVLESSRTLPRELEELDALDRTTLGGAALDAGGRSGPRWTGDD